MTTLRQRMLEDLQIRHYSSTTIRLYLYAVREFAKYFGKSLDQLGAEHIRRYQLFLTKEKKVSTSTYVLMVCALRFFYTHTLHRKVAIERIPFPRREVRVGGVDLKDMDPEDLRNRIGVLFQDFASYELSVRENVMMGRPDSGGNDDQVLEALRNSRSEWLVKKMPNGLDSKGGRLFEGGHDLSGGEWQRLALARIMYRDADIWILDEPTSSLDPEAEAAIFAELKENLKGRIGIVISHRFSTVRIADRIAVIADGRVTEWGTHDELLCAAGRYAQLFELQAAGYR